MTVADELRARTTRFALDAIELVMTLVSEPMLSDVRRQLLRSATGVATNHRASGRAPSRKEFIARLAVVVEEADEAEFWLEALIACRLTQQPAVGRLHREVRELRAIFSAALATAKRNHARAKVRRLAERHADASSNNL